MIRIFLIVVSVLSILFSPAIFSWIRTNKIEDLMIIVNTLFPIIILIVLCLALYKVIVVLEEISKIMRQNKKEVKMIRDEHFRIYYRLGGSGFATGIQRNGKKKKKRRNRRIRSNQGFASAAEEKKRSYKLIQLLSQGKAAYMTWVRLGFLYQENFIKPVKA